MPAKHLVVGFDGMDLDVVRSMGPTPLRALHAMMEEGAYGALESVQPPATLPNWATFLTGLDPAAHGVFDFTTRRGYDVRFTAGSAREAPTLMSRLDAIGKRTACLFFPTTWPPERLEHGIMISGWDAPVAFSANRSFVWPTALHDAIEQRFGTMVFDDVNEFDAERPGWHASLASRLCERIERKMAIAKWLLDRETWDVFAIYFGESDTASHYLWSLHDPKSPRRPPGLTDELQAGLTKVYSTLDHALSTLATLSGKQTEVTVLSDHGFGGSSDKVLYLNRVLEEAGLLHFRQGSTLPSHALRDLALRVLSPALRERIFEIGSRTLPNRLESSVRFGSIDMARTLVFSDELNYLPAIHFNLKGREPLGTVNPSERRALVQRIRMVLLALRDPWTDAPVVREVWEREALYEGPYLERAPDLLLDLHLDNGYSYNLMPSSSAPPASGPWRKLSEHEMLGRKGRSLPGSHRSHGFVAFVGPGVLNVGRIDARIADVASTLLARMGVSVPGEFAGRVCWEALDNTLHASTTKLGDRPPLRPKPVGDRTQVERRLRALGYID